MFVSIPTIQTNPSLLASNTTSTAVQTPRYLGTAKISPRIQLKPSWEPVQNDLSGNVPMDTAYMGEEGLSSIDFTRWDNSVYQVLSSRPKGFGGIPGTNGRLDIGSLMLTEGLAYTVWILFPFATQKAAYSTLNAGYRFPASYLVGPDEHEQMGTHPKTLYLIFHHLRTFNASTGTFTCYDFNMQAVLNPNLLS